MILVLMGAALAAGVHTGIPVNGAVAGIGEPSFQTVETGWTAAVQGGVVRVYVGRTEADAEDWYGRMQQGVQVTLPALDSLGDVACGDGTGIVLVRDGNVGVMVRGANEARAWAERFLSAIVDDERAVAWPAAPSLAREGDRWVAVAADATHVSFQGGRLARGAGLVWVEPPTTLVAWDGFGRASSARFEGGLPLTDPP